MSTSLNSSYQSWVTPSKGTVQAQGQEQAQHKCNMVFLYNNCYLSHPQGFRFTFISLWDIIPDVTHGHLWTAYHRRGVSLLCIFSNGSAFPVGLHCPEKLEVSKYSLWLIVSAKVLVYCNFVSCIFFLSILPLPFPSLCSILFSTPIVFHLFSQVHTN